MPLVTFPADFCYGASLDDPQTLARASAELQRRLEQASEEVRRLEEAKKVSAETMRFEVTI